MALTHLLYKFLIKILNCVKILKPITALSPSINLLFYIPAHKIGFFWELKLFMFWTNMVYQRFLSLGAERTKGTTKHSLLPTLMLLVFVVACHILVLSSANFTNNLLVFIHQARKFTGDTLNRKFESKIENKELVVRMLI